MSRFTVFVSVVVVVLAGAGDASAQGRFGPPPPQFDSPEVSTHNIFSR